MGKAIGRGFYRKIEEIFLRVPALARKSGRASLARIASYEYLLLDSSVRLIRLSRSYPGPVFLGLILYLQQFAARIRQFT
jgi:hypothetical protein